jgi:hypothetical protein
MPNVNNPVLVAEPVEAKHGVKKIKANDFGKKKCCEAAPTS